MQEVQATTRITPADTTPKRKKQNTNRSYPPAICKGRTKKRTPPKQTNKKIHLLIIPPTRPSRPIPSRSIFYYTAPGVKSKHHTPPPCNLVPHRHLLRPCRRINRCILIRRLAIIQIQQLGHRCLFRSQHRRAFPRVGRSGF